MALRKAAEGVKAQARIKKDITWGEAAELFLDWARTYYRHPDGTPTREAENFKDALALFIGPEDYRDEPLRKFTRQDLYACKEALDLLSDELGLSRRTINARLRRIKFFLKWMEDRGVEYLDGKAEMFRSVRGLPAGRSKAKDPKPVAPVEEKDVEAVLPHLTPTLKAMVQVQLLTGMRPGEVCGLKMKFLDRRGKIWIYRPPAHKTSYLGKERQIPIGPRAQSFLKPYLKLDPDAYLFSPRQSEKERQAARRAARKTPLWKSHLKHQEAKRKNRELADHYETAAYRRAITRACQKAGIPAWSPNQLRHAAATKIRREFGLDAARAVLGHSSPAMTEIYAEIDLQKASQVAWEMG